jgi:hypothetical protein
VASILIRLAIGAIVAGALGAANQISGQFGALTAGVAAPLLIQQTAPAGSGSEPTHTDPAGAQLHQTGELPAQAATPGENPSSSPAAPKDPPGS